MSLWGSNPIIFLKKMYDSNTKVEIRIMYETVSHNISLKIKFASMMRALTSKWHRIDFLTHLDQIICRYPWLIWKLSLTMVNIPLVMSIVACISCVLDAFDLKRISYDHWILWEIVMILKT